MRQSDRPGFFLRPLLLDGDAAHSEGLYRLSYWAVRLGFDPRSREAMMASLHEERHRYLNDSTAYGSLMHVVGMLTRERPDEPRHAELLDRLVGMALKAHETYATYASTFMVGGGRADPGLLAAYPEYQQFLSDALAIENSMPNPAVGFQCVQSAIRAAMQPNFLPRFLAEPPDRWLDVDVPVAEQPDARLAMLRDSAFLAEVAASLARWSAVCALPGVREVVVTRFDRDYERTIDEGLDPAIDEIGEFLYEHCRRRLAAAGASCLTYNGHQAYTAAILTHAEACIAPERRGLGLVAAPEGSRLVDDVAGFADERLIVCASRLRAVWLWLDDVPEVDWSVLLVGAPPHGLVVARPASRLRTQYEFGERGPPPDDEFGAVVALRRRAIEADGAPTVEFVLVRTPEQLARLRERVAGELLASCSMSVLAEARWQHAWLAELRALDHLDVLVDLNPFSRLGTWEEQGAFTTAFTTMTFRDDEREHIVFALHPRTGDELVYLAPCSATLAAAMLADLRQRRKRCGLFVPDEDFLTRDMRRLQLVVSHLLREEPWFDFRARAADPESW